MPVEEARSEETPSGRYPRRTGGSCSTSRRRSRCATRRRVARSTRSKPGRRGSATSASTCVSSHRASRSAPPRGDRATRLPPSLGDRSSWSRRRRRTLRQWDYFHCPSETRHVLVGGDEPCVVLMIGARPETEPLHYPVSDVAAKDAASVAKETYEPDEAYAHWPGDYVPLRLRGRASDPDLSR